MRKNVLRLVSLTGSMLFALTAHSQDNQPFRLGAIVDMTGVYSAHGGPGMVTAVTQAPWFADKLCFAKFADGIVQAQQEIGRALITAFPRELYDVCNVDAPGGD